MGERIKRMNPTDKMEVPPQETWTIRNVCTVCGKSWLSYKKVDVCLACRNAAYHESVLGDGPRLPDPTDNIVRMTINPLGKKTRPKPKPKQPQSWIGWIMELLGNDWDDRPSLMS